MKHRFGLIVLIWCWVSVLNAQMILTGTVKDEANKNLSGATLTISKDSVSSILAYAISKSDGSFKIRIDNAPEKLFIKASYIGLTTFKKILERKSQELEIQLRPSSEELKEVVVKSEIIQRRGDTLSFSVEAFKDKNDRVIADVLRKMPGVTIKPGGQIYYQGKPIQKYYIEGLDLLEGRYSLANENLAADDVSKVEILENHQPIRVLDSLEFSERASLNIKLKNDVTLSGTAKLGLGATPLLWEANVTPMLFNKKRQFIASYQSNNTGKNVANQVRDFSFNPGGSTYDIAKTDWVSLLNPATPPFSQDRWLDNNVHLASANGIQRLKSDLDLKLNLSYLNDYQQQQGSTQTTLYTPQDTVSISEVLDNRLFIKNVQGKATLEQNTKKNYLKNQLEFNTYRNTERGMLQRTDAAIAQHLSTPFYGFKNNFDLYKTFGKQLVRFSSNTGFSESDQFLRVRPGQFEDFLNAGNPYAESLQNITSKKLYTDNSAGMTKMLGKFTTTLKLGVALQKESLTSDLVLDDSDTPLGNAFQNDTDFKTSEVYLKQSWRFKNTSETWNIRLGVPVAFKAFDLEGSNAQALDAFVFEPSVYIQHKLAAKWELSISGNLDYNFGRLERLYPGFILTNYRNLQRYNAPILEQVTQNYSTSLNYRNPIKRLFAKASYSYGKTKNNLLFGSQIDPNGTSILEAVVRDNYANSHRFNVEASKYLSRLNTSLKLNASYSISEREQLLNATLVKNENTNFNLNGSLESELSAWLSLTYSGSLMFYNSKLNNSELQQLNTQQHNAEVFFYPWENQYFSLGGEYFKNSLTEANRNYFLNLSYQYTFTKRKIDLKLSWNNMLNTENFINASSSEFYIIQTRYVLRPSQVLASVSFNF